MRSMAVHVALVLLLVAICLGSAGQILIKTGLMRLGERPTPQTVVLSIFRSAHVAGGFGCYFASSILYLLAVSKLNLSYAYPMVALSYVVVTVLAWRMLDEPLPRLRVVGLAVILLGVTLMALSYRDARRRVPEPPPTVQGELPDAGQ